MHWITRALVVLVGSGLLGLLGGPHAMAGSSDADGTYTVTVTMVELSTDGVTFITVFEGSQAINIAAVNAGAVAAGLIGGTSITAGSYTRVRYTVDGTLLVKGFVNTGGMTHYTDGSGGGFTTVAGNDPGADYATSTFSIPAEFRTGTDTISAMEVGPGLKPVITITFNTTGVILTTPDIGPPSVSIASR